MAPNAALFVVGGALVVTWNVITVSLRQRIVPEHLMGRVNAGYPLLAWGTMPIGAALGGAIAEVFSIRTVFAVASLGQLGLVACFRGVTDSAIDEAERTGTAR